GASPSQAANFASNAPTYWGDQTYVGAPAYIGASVIFLFVFALFLVKGRLKWWIVAGSLLALLLSWGKNFAFLTHFFINYVPLYNKFRAVSSIQVIIELCVPILAIFGLYRVFNDFEKKEEKLYALKWATIITGGLALLFLVFKSALFSFTGGNDATYLQQMGSEFMRALKEDRKAIFMEDTIRSLIFVGITAGLIWLYLKEKAGKNLIIAGFALLILADLMAVDKRYVNESDFVAARTMKKPFQETAADAQILQDTTHYRVFDLSTDPFNSGRASYFHNAVGGYSAAKPGRMQDLYDFYISQNNMKILNMLNVKYFIIPSKKGGPQAQENPGTYGNAWFVDAVKWSGNANQEIENLNKVPLDSVAVLNDDYKTRVPATLKADSSARIKLIQYRPNKLVYKSKSSEKSLAIFSEIYYPDGWTAAIDSKEAQILNADYVLRALVVPAGTHTIEFNFNPKIVKTGSTISLASSAILFLLLVGGVFFAFKQKE
ncbi:MAG: YfhO family protein, partial [Gillisia sp.]